MGRYLVAVHVALGMVIFVAGDVVGQVTTGDPRPACERPFAQGEWGTDTVVVARLSRAPAVGETATLTAEMCAKEAGPLSVTIELPDGFDWVRAPAGMSLSRRVSPNPANFGCLDVVSGVWSVAARQPVRLTATVAAHTAGFATVTVTAHLAGPTRPGMGNADSVFVTVGQNNSSSYFGYRMDPGDARAVPVPPTPPVPSCG